MSPAVTNGAAASAGARIRGDGTARTTGLKAFLALRDTTGTWSSMACRVCGYVQNQNKNQTPSAKGRKGAARHPRPSTGVGAKSVGKVMNAVSSRSSLDCGCMRKWEVVIDGLSYRFCSGCKLYHELKYFENEKSAKKPSKVCAVFKERRRLRKLAAAHGARDDAAGSSRLQDPIGIGSNARRGRGTARVGSPNPGSDSVSPADSVSGDRGGSLGSNDAANTGITNGGEAKAGVVVANGGVGDQAFAPFVEDVVDRFVVDGGSNRYGEERAHKLRNCSMFNRSTGGDGFDHFLNTFINDPVGVNVGMNAGFDAAPPHGFLRNAFSTFSAKVPGHVRDVADAGGRGDLHGDFVSSCSTARCPNKTRARGSATSSRAPSSSAWTRSTSPRDAPRASTRFAPWTTCSLAGKPAIRRGWVGWRRREGGFGSRRMRRRLRRRLHLPRARGPQHRRAGALPGPRAEGRPRGWRPPLRILRHRSSHGRHNRRRPRS